MLLKHSFVRLMCPIHVKRWIYGVQTPKEKEYYNHEILYFFGYKTEFFFLPKQSQNSRSILKDGSRSLGLFRKGKTHIIAKFQRTDFVICSHSKRGENPVI